MNKAAFFLLFSALIAITGCNSGVDEVAFMKVFNASPDLSAIDVVIGDRFEALGVQFGEVSPTVVIKKGTKTFQTTAAGTSDSLINETLSVGGGDSFTYVVLDFRAQIGTLLLSNGVRVRDLGETELRIVNLAPSSEGFDVYITAPDDDIGDTIPDFSELFFTEDTDYFILDMGDFRVRLTEPGTKNVLLDTGTFTQGIAQIHTLMVIDSPGGGEPFGFSLIMDAG